MMFDLSIDGVVNFVKSWADAYIESDTVQQFVALLHTVMGRIGIPETIHPTADQVVLSTNITILTLLLYYHLIGRSHHSRRLQLTSDLHLAALRVLELEDLLLTQSKEENRKKGGGEVRIFMDGAFDMMHYGHMNAFRQGRSLGTQLIVGVNSDESITRCKGSPVMTDRERLTAVEGCKFVDEVIPGCPYVMTSDYLDYVIKKYDIDYVVHGDDPCVVDGKDVYESAKERGKYQSIPRTEGVSTTDIVGRMLLMTKDHHKRSGFEEDGAKLITAEKDGMKNNEILGTYSKFLTTSRMLRLFSVGVEAPEEGQRVVYMDGSWDMFHAGHISILKKAKEMGDYLIAGVHSDAIVNQHQGSNMPIMNLHERVLSVLGCKFVDDVLIDAPYTITPEMIASLKISQVIRGAATKTDEGLRYEHAINAGIYRKIDSPCDFSLDDIFERIQASQKRFENKIEKKKRQEQEYYDNLYGMKNGEKK
ncbi:hypothetical protein TrST_g8974 [Triparma strigata]|uniref:ethanolamine-phosphate cytidylyltransferase n=1 Tax=Triparma strigata TaxID=1606541 RepID=A0A9W7B9Q3_9STRA|nr:hypothetical protein TrST_g8974 [Triparma strigata]